MPNPTNYHNRLAQQIIARVGGTSNIKSVSHCTTRLRFQLKRIPVDAVKEINQLPEVIAVMNFSGLFQIVIGTEVEKVYQAVLPLLKTSASTEIPSHLTSVISTITSIFNPILWLLSAAGILKGLIILFVNLNWLEVDNGTYLILFSSADAIFYFLPILLGYTSAKHFGTNPLFGIAIAGALVHPEISNHVDWLFLQNTAGVEVEPDNFLGLQVEFLKYSNSVLPIIFATWFNVRLEQLSLKTTSDFLSKWLAPFLCLSVTIPLTFLVIGPASIMVAKYISSGVFFLYHSSPEVAGFVIGAIWQVMVVFGIHWSFVPILMNNSAVNGYDVLPPLLIPAVFGQVGACMGVLLLSLRKKEANYAGTAALTAIFGVTEPAIYAITLPRKWPFIFGCLSAAVGSSIVAYFQAKAYSLGMPSLFSFVQIVPHSGIDDSVIATILATLLTLVSATLLTYFFTPMLTSRSDLKASARDHNPPPPPVKDKEIKHAPQPDLVNKEYLQIQSPLIGEVIPLAMVNDPTFSSESMGQGVAIRPEQGELKAPFNGKVASVFKTHHSIGLESDDGVQMLIHIGLDTVKLNGKGFKLLVKVGQEITEGQPLILFDLQVLTTLGYDTTTPIVITNSDDYFDVISTSNLHTTTGDTLLTII
ncbi:PTS beta-glucoside transporter subunit IIABC [Vibrio parahaemolyticus]|nr:PTS beta-glucoside transporter subunit IIABC [Vibrio parahaemolyticus]